MKKVIIFLLLFSAIFCTEAKQLPKAIVFYSPHCKTCLQLKKEFLSKIEQKYKDKITWEALDTSNNQENLFKLIAVSARARNKQGSVPSVLIGNILLIGKDEITNKLETTIEQVLKEKHEPLSFLKIDPPEVFKKISVLAVILSGLIDGVNPCAFAVIVFFVSFLAVYGYRRREIIYIGASYCCAVFITYLLIGLGLFNFLYSMVGFYAIIKSFYYFIAVFCFVLAAFALRDFLKYRKTGEAQDMILQLPAFLKKRVNLVIGSHLRQKEEGVWSLCASAFVVGFLVSLLEAVCTGQVYLPTIVFILKSTHLRLKALSYLLLYNFMFVLPLVLVFALSLLGFSSQRFNKFLKENLGGIKLLMFLLFLLLGLVILWIS
jgi:cytochrome c biogenesis protein CcdA